MSQGRDSGRTLSIAEAAQTIYKVDAPSEQQIGRVYAHMKSGALRVNHRDRPSKQWTTSEDAVADFLAGSAMKQYRAQRLSTANAPAASAAKRHSRDGSGQTIVAVYRDIWRDYFLAVMLRRRREHHSARFRRAVIAGQVVVLIVMLGAIAIGIRVVYTPVAPERVAVERWIDERTDRHSITCWHPTRPSKDGAGVIVEVEYRYAKDSPRVVSTRRVFVYDGTSVQEVAEE
jgi:hypothetical protein